MFPNSNLGSGNTGDRVGLTPAPPRDDVPWWLRYGAKAAGLGGGIVAMALGVWTCLNISPLCIVAGIWLVLAGFLVTALEAPCCCMFVDFVQQFSNWADTRPYWMKAVGYTLLAIPDLILCRKLSAIFGSCFLIIAAVLYGMMALGKKASRAEMSVRAQSTTNMTLVDDKGQPHDVESGGHHGGRT